MNKDEFYMGIAKKISDASKCLRSHWGVVVVKNDMIIGTGFNGPARGVSHCNPCHRADYPSGQGYSLCKAVHGEVNAIIQAGGRAGCLGAILYIGSNRRPSVVTAYNTGMGDFPCDNCARVIVNAGIAKVVQEEDGPGGIILVEYNIPELVSCGRIT
jgi:dCMP deaminase